MITLIIYAIGATAIFIQYRAMEAALESKNFFAIKKAVIDVCVSGAIFVLAASGGVGGFYIAVMASFAITIYLSVIKKADLKKPEPQFWITLKNRS